MLFISRFAVVGSGRPTKTHVPDQTSIKAFDRLGKCVIIMYLALLVTHV